MHIGAAYYPEHWPPERWPHDARLMKEAGINVVRLAEFAWAKMEPVEGKYEFGWLDRAIEILAAEGIRAILGTTTEAMPAWLAQKYPEARAVTPEGRAIPYGARRDNCPTSASYRRLGQRIAAAMAEHYKNNPHVIGWQIDNEFGGPYCYCRACEHAWREQLRREFGTIEELNRRWGTIFWSHCYASFDEVELPRRGAESNPSLLLEHRRFHSRQVVAFQHEQAEILRRITPDKFITHNMCGVFLDQVDYYQLARDLDFCGLDYYYNNSPWGNRFNVAAYEQLAMDATRSYKKRSFWVTETPAGVIGSQWYLRSLRPLEMRRMNFQALAHGADGLLWFRWRTCRFGNEQFTNGILGHDGVPGRHYQDVKQVAGEFHALAPQLEGSRVRADVALVYSYANRWALTIQPCAQKFDYVGHLLQYHRACKREGINVDLVYEAEALDGYRVVILPTGFVLTPEFAKRLERFVKNGGILLVTTRTGVKDYDNVPYDVSLPGLLRPVLGLRIEEYEALLEESPVCFQEAQWGGGTFQAHLFADWIVSEGAQTVAVFTDAPLQNRPAATVHKFGRGEAYYIGTAFVTDEAIRRLLRKIFDAAAVKRYARPPEGVGISVREKGLERFLFLLNHNDQPVEVPLDAPPCVEMLTKKDIFGRCSIPAGEVVVLHWKESEPA